MLIKYRKLLKYKDFLSNNKINSRIFSFQGLVRDLLNKKDELGNQAEISTLFDLNNVQDRQIADLSGGELQRFACAMVCIQKGDIFMFDEPSSYLDVKQRLKAALAIRDIIRQNRFVRFSSFTRK